MKIYFLVIPLVLVAAAVLVASENRVCSYGRWGQCSALCMKHRIETCKSNGRKERIVQQARCSPLECHTLQLPTVLAVNGSWSDWGPWTSCSKSCGVGVRVRSRTCTNPRPSNGGEHCQGSLRDIDECEDVKCPVNGQWGNWSEWNKCTESGKRHRHRKCDNPEPQYGGANCRGTPTETSWCVICADSVKMSLTPGRVKCRLGKPTTFTCTACTSGVGHLSISMDTVPVSTSDSATLDRNITEPNTCLQHIWVVHLNEDHKRVVCLLKNGEDIIGTMTSTIKITVPRKCNSDEFRCPGHQFQCIPMNKVCDGVADCNNQADEDWNRCGILKIPKKFCGLHEYQCDNGECVNRELRCNEVIDCSDGSDEKLCGLTIPNPCQDDQFRCSNNRCVSKTCRCDSQNDCGDHSDELQCTKTVRRSATEVYRFRSVNNCKINQFCCKNKLCVDNSCRCNRVDECGDNSDEVGCIQYQE